MGIGGAGLLGAAKNRLQTRLNVNPLNAQVNADTIVVSIKDMLEGKYIKK